MSTPLAATIDVKFPLFKKSQNSGTENPHAPTIDVVIPLFSKRNKDSRKENGGRGAPRSTDADASDFSAGTKSLKVTCRTGRCSCRTSRRSCRTSRRHMPNLSTSVSMSLFSVFQKALPAASSQEPISLCFAKEIPRPTFRARNFEKPNGKKKKNAKPRKATKSLPILWGFVRN